MYPLAASWGEWHCAGRVYVCICGLWDRGTGLQGGYEAQEAMFLKKRAPFSIDESQNSVLQFCGELAANHDDMLGFSWGSRPPD